MSATAQEIRCRGQKSDPKIVANIMETKKQKALQAAGWKVGEAADFLEMSPTERQLLEARVQLAMAIRKQREAQQLTQQELGTRLKTTQPRVARIERAASDVSFDQLVRAFAAAGGRFVVKLVAAPNRGRKAAARTENGTFVLEACHE